MKYVCGALRVLQTAIIIGAGKARPQSACVQADFIRFVKTDFITSGYFINEVYFIKKSVSARRIFYYFLTVTFIFL